MSSAGFVLVGGNSSRMGQDKALVRWRNAPVVEHVAAQVREAAGSATLIGQPGRYSHLNLPCLPDRYEGRGPLGGIHSALSAHQARYNVVVACDMPDLDASLLKRLLSAARSAVAPCVFVLNGSRRHPLCAVYREDALPAVERSLQTGQLRLHDLLDALAAEPFETDTILRNCNTPAEWMELEASLDAR